MIRNLTFALLLLATCACTPKNYPSTYTDETGVYKQVHDNVYHRKGDHITAKGYREYKLIGWKKGDSQTVLQPSQQVATKPKD